MNVACLIIYFWCGMIVKLLHPWNYKTFPQNSGSSKLLHHTFRNINALYTISTSEPSDFSELLLMDFSQWSADSFEELTDTQFPLQGRHQHLSTWVCYLMMLSTAKII